MKVSYGVERRAVLKKSLRDVRLDSLQCSDVELTSMPGSSFFERLASYGISNDQIY